MQQSLKKILFFICVIVCFITKSNDVSAEGITFVVSSVSLEENGKCLGIGDTVHISAELESNFPVESVNCMLGAYSQNISGIELFYNSKTGLYEGEYTITKNIYGEEYVLRSITAYLSVDGTRVSRSVYWNGDDGFGEYFFEVILEPFINFGWTKDSGNVGETVPLGWLEVKPTGIDVGEITWTSSNTDAIIVDENGTLALKAAGSAIIKVTASNGVTCSKTFTSNMPENGYIGNINSELISFDLKQNESGAYYLTGQIIVVEWIKGASTVPEDTPTMIFKSTDGTEEIEVFVTPTGTNTYYFDRFVEGLSPNKEYVFEISSGTEKNISPNRSMNVLLSTSPQIVPIKNLGKIGEQKISYYQADNGELRLYRRNSTYVGNINSELIKTELVKGPNGNYVSGQIVVVEWENGVSTVPFETPIMYFKSTDGTESLPVFVTPTGTNTYYFDRSLGDMDTTKEYVFTITSGDSLNVSLYKSMIVTTAAMTNKEGLLWQSDTQYVRYRTDANTGELRIYAVNK